jgi:(3S)-linalool synthase
LAPLQTDDKTKNLDQVKRRSREALLNSSDPMVTMKMIDSIQGLGISHHLENEINVQLRRISDWDPSNDLFATSLQFRLLRHNGWSTNSGTILFNILGQIYVLLIFLCFGTFCQVNRDINKDI